MADFFVSIPGALDIAGINLAIIGEEAGASEYLSSEVQSVSGQLTNLAKFRELGPGTIPTRPQLLLSNAVPPAGAGLIWSGVMLISGAMTAVKMFR